MSPITATQIQALKNIRPALRVVTYSSRDYDKAITRAWPIDERRAGAVVFPGSTGDVAAVIRFASSEKITIAVKSGGHGHYGSSTDGGLCIDMSLMDKVSVNAADRRVEVGGGARWDHVYPVAAKEGLALVGGETSTVGVGGLALHGGYGWLAGAHGLALDNILAMEIVLASGEVAIVSDSENEDLFWAMKGAGGSFGFVTKFVLRAFEQKREVWFEFMVLGLLSDEHLEAVVEVSNRVLSEENKDDTAALNWTVEPETSTDEEKLQDFQDLLDCVPDRRAFDLVWTDEKNDRMCKDWLKKHHARWVEEFERRREDDDGVDPVTKKSTGIYPNYDGYESSAKEIFGVNYEPLLELKKKYDPENMLVGPGRFTLGQDSVCFMLLSKIGSYISRIMSYAPLISGGQQTIIERHFSVEYKNPLTK